MLLYLHATHLKCYYRIGTPEAHNSPKARSFPFCLTCQWNVGCRQASLSRTGTRRESRSWFYTCMRDASDVVLLKYTNTRTPCDTSFVLPLWNAGSRLLWITGTRNKNCCWFCTCMRDASQVEDFWSTQFQIEKHRISSFCVGWVLPNSTMVLELPLTKLLCLLIWNMGWSATRIIRRLSCCSWFYICMQLIWGSTSEVPLLKYYFWSTTLEALLLKYYFWSTTSFFPSFFPKFSALQIIHSFL